MKKIVSLALVVMMICTLSVSIFADARDFEAESGANWTKVLHASRDDLQDATNSGTKFNAVFPTGTTEFKFWGWVSAAAEIKGYSYSINGGDKIALDASAKIAPEFTKQVASSVEEARFKAPVPVTEGTQLVRLFADFEDSSELVWIVEVTVGEATDYTDAAASVPGDGEGSTDDKNPTENPATADVAVVVIATVAAFALAGVVVSKKVKV